MRSEYCQKEERSTRKSDVLELERIQGSQLKEEELKKKNVEVESVRGQLGTEKFPQDLPLNKQKEYLLKTVEDEVKMTLQSLSKSWKAEQKKKQVKSQEYVVTAIQKCAADHVAETTISVVQLPN